MERLGDGLRGRGGDALVRNAASAMGMAEMRTGRPA